MAKSMTTVLDSFPDKFRSVYMHEIGECDSELLTRLLSSSRPSRTDREAVEGSLSSWSNGRPTTWSRSNCQRRESYALGCYRSVRCRCFKARWLGRHQVRSLARSPEASVGSGAAAFQIGQRTAR